MSYISR